METPLPPLRPADDATPIGGYFGEPTHEQGATFQRRSRVHINSSSRRVKTEVTSGEDLLTPKDPMAIVKDRIVIYAPKNGIEPGSSVNIRDVELRFPLKIEKLAVFGGRIASATGGMFFLADPVPFDTFWGDNFSTRAMHSRANYHNVKIFDPTFELRYIIFRATRETTIARVDDRGVKSIIAFRIPSSAQSGEDRMTNLETFIETDVWWSTNRTLIHAPNHGFVPSSTYNGVPIAFTTNMLKFESQPCECVVHDASLIALENHVFSVTFNDSSFQYMRPGMMVQLGAKSMESTTPFEIVAIDRSPSSLYSETDDVNSLLIRSGDQSFAPIGGVVDGAPANIRAASLTIRSDRLFSWHRDSLFVGVVYDDARIVTGSVQNISVDVDGRMRVETESIFVFEAGDVVQLSLYPETSMSGRHEVIAGGAGFFEIQHRQQIPNPDATQWRGHFGTNFVRLPMATQQNFQARSGDNFEIWNVPAVMHGLPVDTYSAYYDSVLTIAFPRTFLGEFLFIDSYDIFRFTASAETARESWESASFSMTTQELIEAACVSRENHYGRGSVWSAFTWSDIAAIGMCGPGLGSRIVETSYAGELLIAQNDIPALSASTISESSITFMRELATAMKDVRPFSPTEPGKVLAQGFLTLEELYVGLDWSVRPFATAHFSYIDSALETRSVRSVSSHPFSGPFSTHIQFCISDLFNFAGVQVSLTIHPVEDDVATEAGFWPQNCACIVTISVTHGDTSVDFAAFPVVMRIDRFLVRRTRILNGSVKPDEVFDKPMPVAVDTLTGTMYAEPSTHVARTQLTSAPFNAADMTLLATSGSLIDGAALEVNYAGGESLGILSIAPFTVLRVEDRARKLHLKAPPMIHALHDYVAGSGNPLRLGELRINRAAGALGGSLAEPPTHNHGLRAAVQFPVALSADVFYVDAMHGFSAMLSALAKDEALSNSALDDLVDLLPRKDWFSPSCFSAGRFAVIGNDFLPMEYTSPPLVYVPRTGPSLPGSFPDSLAPVVWSDNFHGIPLRQIVAYAGMTKREAEQNWLRVDAQLRAYWDTPFRFPWSVLGGFSSFVNWTGPEYFSFMLEYFQQPLTLTKTVSSSSANYLEFSAQASMVEPLGIPLGGQMRVAVVHDIALGYPTASSFSVRLGRPLRFVSSVKLINSSIPATEQSVALHTPNRVAWYIHGDLSVDSYEAYIPAVSFIMFEEVLRAMTNISALILFARTITHSPSFCES